MRLLSAIATALLLALSSCSTISHTCEATYVETKVVSVTVADMNVQSQRVEHTSSWKWSPFKRHSVSKESEKATGELLKEQQADVLVEPQYTVQRRGLFRGGSVTVSGYPATYYNFRPMTQEDATAIATLDGKLSCGGSVINTSAPIGRVENSKPGFFKRVINKVKGIFKRD